ncbi:MAG TPA: class I SAM-dependent methyltransferase [Vicinamibacterales bacterium]|nr:class I SAM-dependent methyltransferase [Vicinamibacterales bacterium]
MRRFRPAPVVVLALCSALAVPAASAAAPQAQQAPQQGQKQYEPEVGQAGKDVVWVPTSEALVQKMLDLAKVTPDDFVIDLGSGDGRTVIAAAKRGARAHGIEYNPEMVELSKKNATAAGVAGKATFEKADLFETDFSKATVITMFLLPSINVKLRPTLLELEPGTRIVSNTFTMEDWEADQTATVEEGCESWCTALLWIVPARVDGTWQLPGGRLTLTQTFQEVAGSITRDGKNAPIGNGHLRGTEFIFTVGTTKYQATVNGDTMEGTITASGKTQPFKATKTSAAPKPAARK